MPDQVHDAPLGPGGLIRPMLATAGPVPTTDRWAFEVKFDGIRAIAYTTPSGLRLFSRNDRDITTTYPDVTSTDLRQDVVLDGELVALDERGRPDFTQLQLRMHLYAPGAGLLARVPVRYVVFDLLHHQQSMIGMPYHDRRARLVDLDLGRYPALQVPGNFVDVPGASVLAAVDHQGLEGIVAKRLDSTYQPGTRSRHWIKTAIRHTHEVIVAGWTSGSGNRHNSLGALVLAAHDDDDHLVHVGDVGTGFTTTARARLLDQLQPLQRPDPPFGQEFIPARGWLRAPARRPIRWVQPLLVGEIEYRSFTTDGYFRHPSWQGLHPNRDPDQVRLPPPT